MTLTIQQIYERYSVRTFARKIEIKRVNSSGVYESNWQDVEELSLLNLLEKSVKSINYTMSNNNYNFGIVNIGNVTVSLNSKNGQFDDENNGSSIFKNFVRHKSLIRIRDGYVDDRTDPENPVSVYQTVFQGFIDATATGTKVDDNNLIQNLQCVDMLSFLLKEYTLVDMGTLTSTNLDSLIYEILNRSEFTDFFNVNAGNINAGYNITSFDISQYEDQITLYELFENFSIGHSFFYVTDEVFYYKGILEGTSKTFTVDEKKLIKFSRYNNGIANVFERLFWQDQPAITFTAASNKYNKTLTIDIPGATDNTQRQNLLDSIGNISKIQRRGFTIDIPYFMDVFVLDEIIIESPQIIPENAFIWGFSRWGDGSTWQRSLQADNIPNNVAWLVIGVKHSNYKTTLTLQEIV